MLSTKALFLAGLASLISSASAAVTVKPVPWIPANPASPHTVVTGTLATLTATVDLGGSTDAFTYSWNFGDGSSPTAAAPITNNGRSTVIGNINNLSVTHSYPAATGAMYTAVLTVTDTNTSTTSTGNYYIVVQANTLAARVNQAIDGGLWFLHTTMERGTVADASENSVNIGGWDGGIQGCRSVLDCLGAAGLDATNVQAFEVSGHLENGPSTDPYTDDVARGLAHIMKFMTAYANNGSAGGFGSGQKTISYNPALSATRCSDGSLPANYGTANQSCTAPATLINYNSGATSCTIPPCSFTYDGNGNGQILIQSNDDAGDAGYQTGMLVTAIVASQNPAGIAKLGQTASGSLRGVQGQTYFNIVQDLIDGIGYCQYYANQGNPDGSDNGGGWEYNCAAVENPNYTDNSPSQWNAIALIAANRGFGIAIPPIVQDTNQVWVTWDQCFGSTCTDFSLTPGEFGYDSWTDPIWGPWAVTPSGMVQFAMDGIGRTAAGAADQRWNLSESYYRDNFCSTGGDATTNPKLYTYGLFSFTKSMEQHAPQGVLAPITFLSDMPGGTNPIDWYGAEAANGDPCDGVAQTLVSRQQPGGYWNGVDYTGSQFPFETAWSVQMLQKTSFTACVSTLSGMGVTGPAADLTWSSMPTAISYNVQRSPSNGGPYTTIGNTVSTSFTDNNGLTGGSTYFYVLQPLNANSRAICTSNQTSVAVPNGGDSRSNGNPLTVTGADSGTIPLGGSVSVSISVSGGTAPYSYTPASVAPAGMFINGATVSGTPTQPGNYSVGIIVSDSATPPNRASASVTFSVFGLSASLPAGIAFSPYVASVGAAGGRPPYTYSFSFLPPGLSATNSGTIQGTVRAPGSWNVTITATDAGGATVSTAGTFVFTAPGPISLTTALPSGTAGTTYSAGLTATGGAPPFTWSIGSGSLPGGLNLQPTGVISGIPANYGSYSFGVRATDVTGAMASGVASLTISPVPLVITTSSPLSTGTMNVEYPAQTLTASGGVPPYTFAITSGSLPKNITFTSNGANAMIGGIPASTGDFMFTVTASDSSAAQGLNRKPRSASELNPINRNALLPRAATGSANLEMTIRGFANDLVLGAGSLAFSLPAGSMAVPPAQTVSVTATGSTPIAYGASAGASWLSVTSSDAQTPGALTVALTPQALSLAASTTPYTATITVDCTNAGQCSQPSQTIAVSLTVSTVPPQLSVPATLLSFTTPASGPAASQQGLTVQNTGGGSIGFANATCEAAWCTVANVPGSIAGGTAANLTVTADPNGLAAGFYRTQVDLKTSAGIASVPVTLFISSGSSMTLQPAGALFQSIAGGVPNGGDNSFLVDVVGNNSINWTAVVLPGASWLSVTTPSGSSTGPQPGSVSFAIDPVAAAALMPGAYYGTVRVSASSGITNSPQDFQMVLSVAPANAIQTPSPSPAGLLYIAASGTLPPPQSITVTTNSSAPVSFSASPGASWLSLSATGGTATSKNPAQIQVSANPSNLNPGVYYGSVTFNFNGFSETRAANVTLLVPQPGFDVHDKTPGNESASAGPKAATCTPAQVVAAQIGLASNFSAPTGWPTPLAMQLLDDCGNYRIDGQVVATFTNGDPALPLSLANPATGLYAATWTPRKAGAQVTVNAKVAIPGLPGVTAQLAGAVTSNAAPLLDSNTTLNIYNPVAAAAVAPGTLVQITGSGLAGTAGAATTSPLPTNLNGTQVIVGGTAAPLSSVSPGTLQAQLPFELMPGMQYQVVVNANGALTAPVSIQVAAGAPGVLASLSGLLNATHIDGSAITEASPAQPGEYIVLLAAGLGSTDKPVADGAPGPSSPLANALDMPSVTINGESAAITFAGLEPGKVGVYQVNVQVPSDAPNGDLTLILSQDGNPSNSGTLPVKKM